MISKKPMQRILATALFSVSATGAALTADLPPAAAPPPRAPAVYAPPPPVYNWSGFYLGINGGWGFGKSDWNLSTLPFDTGSFSVNGGLVGGTIGANWQSDWFVAGIEGDFDGSWMDGTASTCATATAFVSTVNCETKNNWLATIRGRVGYAADRILFYATGGVAFGDIVVNTAANWQSADKTGWTAGAGIEGAFTDHWTARVEYLFVDLQNSSFTATNVLLAPVPVTTKFDANLIRAGLDYKF
jgi:outer membrane immunogenic protein